MVPAVISTSLDGHATSPRASRQGGDIGAAPAAMPAAQSARVPAQNFRSDLFELLARLRFDHRWPDDRRDPDVRHEAATVEDMHLRSVVDDPCRELGRLEVA